MTCSQILTNEKLKIVLKTMKHARLFSRSVPWSHGEVHQPGLSRSLCVASVKEIAQFPPPLEVSRFECLGFLGHVAVWNFPAVNQLRPSSSPDQVSQRLTACESVSLFVEEADLKSVQQWTFAAWTNHVYKALSSCSSFFFRISEICCLLTPNSRVRFVPFSNREITVYHLSIKQTCSCCCKLWSFCLVTHNPRADPHAITTDQAWHSFRVRA